MQIKRVQLSKIVSILLSTSIIISLLSACGNGYVTQSAYRKVNDSILETNVIATNTNYKLCWDNNAKAAVLKNLEDDFIKPCMLDIKIGTRMHCIPNSDLLFIIRGWCTTS